jgi:ferredoxin
MAELAQRVAENVPGPFYVDRTCIDCDLCRETAPANFTRNDRDGYSYVFRQPRDDAEQVACENAMAECPVEAIGADREPSASSRRSAPR